MIENDWCSKCEKNFSPIINVKKLTCFNDYFRKEIIEYLDYMFPGVGDCLDISLPIDSSFLTDVF